MSYNLTGAVQGGNLTLGKAGLAAGTTTTYTITNTFTYSLKGQLFSKASATNAASPTTDYNTGVAFLPLSANQSCIFAFGVDSSGNVGVIQSLPFDLKRGIFPSTSDMAGGLGSVQFPGVPDALAVFGYLLAQASTALVGTWTFGANNMSGVTGMTYTFRDVMDVPAQPITG